MLDERRCAYCYLEYRIGIPNQIKLLIDTLLKNTDVPGLFRNRAPVTQIELLRRSLEEERGIPPDTSIHTVAQCFLQWLYELPEPLIGYELFSPIQSCQEIEIEVDRLRNISLLLDAVPWWNQPCLNQVMKLLYALTRPEKTQLNQLNIIAVSIFATPFIIRSSVVGPISGRGMTNDEIDRLHMIAVASGSVVTQLFIEYQPIIFERMRKQQLDLYDALKTKCDRLRDIQIESLQFLITHPASSKKSETWTEKESKLEANDGDENDDEYLIDEMWDTSELTIARERELYLAMYTLWEDLRITHYRLHEYQLQNEQTKNTEQTPSDSIPSESLEGSATSTATSPQKVLLRCLEIESATQLDDVVDERDDFANRVETEDLLDWENSVPASTERLMKLMKSKRWEVCFPVENALREFNSQPGGMLAIRYLSQFIKRFGDKASLIICEFALKRSAFCSLPMVCIYLTQICLVGLKLVSPHQFTQIMASHSHPHSISHSSSSSPQNSSPSPVSSVVVSSNTNGSEGEIDYIKIRTIAREMCWTLLNEDTCLEQLLSISLLTFDDLWKHMLPSDGGGLNDSTRSDPPEVSKKLSKWFQFPTSSPSQSLTQQQQLGKDLLAACMTGCRILIDELLYVNNVTTSEELWKLWTEQRILRQQTVVEAQLNYSKQQFIEKELQTKYSQQEQYNKEIEEENKLQVEQRIKESQSCQISPSADPSVLLKVTSGITSKIYGNRDDIILSLHEIEVLEEHLPASIQCCDWELKYSLTRDGASINTMIRLARGCRQTLLVIEDTYGCHFGAVVVDDPWMMMGDKYYGNGTCRVFSFHNTEEKTTETESSNMTESYKKKCVESLFRIYESSMKNYYFMLTSPDTIGLGGGGGGFAIMLDGDLNHGTSNNNCETFDSPVLSTHSEFICSRCNLYSIRRSDGNDDIDREKKKSLGVSGRTPQKSLFQIEG